jgi:4-amino-4-deoxy-L-arabinose transferase-like glycosyltransferase
MQPARPWLRAALCALVAAMLYLPGLGRPALWEPDEGRYAEIAREMVVTRDYVTPRIDGLRYFEKPPLVYWAEAASIRIFGANEFAVRAPAALCTAAEVGATCAIGEAMFGAEVGILAALALALSPLVFGFARFATLDPPLAFLLSAALGAFYAASKEQDFGSGAGRRWMCVSAGLLALGTLVKGPVAPLLGGAIALAWMLWERRRREIARIPFFACIVIFAAIAVPWFAVAAMRNPGFLHFFVVHEHVQRFLESTEHGWGPYFFIPIVAGGAWPWLFFVPLGILEMRRREEESRELNLSAFRFLTVWFVLIFVFFSIPRSKLGSYILPAMPPLAIVAGFALARLEWLQPSRRARWLGAFAVANVILAAAAAIALDAFLAHRHPELARDGIIIAAIDVAAGIGVFVVGRRGRAGRRIAAALAAAMVLVVVTAEHARSDAAALFSYRTLARALTPYRDCTLASYRHYVQSLPFYTGMVERPVEYFGELAEFEHHRGEDSIFIGREDKLVALWSSGGCMILVANRKDLPALLKILSPAPVSVGCEGKKVALLNGPPRVAPPSGCAPIGGDGRAAFARALGSGRGGR